MKTFDNIHDSIESIGKTFRDNMREKYGPLNDTELDFLVEVFSIGLEAGMKQTAYDISCFIESNCGNRISDDMVKQISDLYELKELSKLT